MGTRGIRKKFTSSAQNNQHLELMRSAKDFIRTAKANNFYNGEALEIDKLIENIPNLEIRHKPLDSSISGSLYREGDKWIITVNSSHHPRRQRFTLAHELGHFVYHKDEDNQFDDTTFFRGVSNDNIESKANEFASELLMPEDVVRNLIDIENIRNIENLSKHFDVSAAAMLYRVKELGYKTKE